MNQLTEYYQKRLLILTVLIVAVVLLVPNLLVPYLIDTFGKDHWSAKIADLLTSRFAIVCLFVAGEVVIRKWLWKFEKSEFNFDGNWEGTTTYRYVRVGKADVPFEGKHRVMFEQDCLHFAIAPQPGDAFVNWGSLAINLADKDTVQYAYWVKYRDPSKFPDKAIGYEEMKVIERDKKKKPQALSGEFYHCAQGLEPVYSGSVIFRRAKS